VVKFEWDAWKSITNELKHGVSFEIAAIVFADPSRRVFKDERHSIAETRWYCLGRVEGRVLTVRFIYRRQVIRIIGAGYWRKGRKLYEEGQKNEF
jgi:uncharacterized DUF497 family protein